MTEETHVGRPRIALVTWGLGDPGTPSGEMSRLIAEEHDRIDFVVFSRKIGSGVRPLVEWRKIPVPNRPLRLRWVVFFIRAGLRLRRVGADLVHTVGAPHLIPNRVDVASVRFCYASYHEALGRPSLLKRPARRFTLALERWGYASGRTRMLVVQSPGAKREFERHYPGISITTVASAIDTERFRPDPSVRARMRKDHGADEDDVVALFVGRDFEFKGLAIVIEALGHVARDGTPPLLWILGDGRGRRRLEKLAARWGVRDRLRFFGWRLDPERFYQAADIFVLPTLSEIFCRSAHEAAASELPVVATSVSGVRELVGKDEAGILVERNPVAVGKALALLSTDPGLRAAKGVEGRRRALKFTQARWVDGMRQVYARLLSGSV